MLLKQFQKYAVHTLDGLKLSVAFILILPVNSIKRTV